MFSDNKAPDAFRTIGEVAKALSLKPHVLRYWEDQFPTLRPVKRAGGRRYYRPEDIALVAQIDRLVHHEGYTLKGAKALLAGKAAVPQASVTPVNIGSPPASETLASLRSIRNTLAEALGA